MTQPITIKDQRLTPAVPPVSDSVLESAKGPLAVEPQSQAVRYPWLLAPNISLVTARARELVLEAQQLADRVLGPECSDTIYRQQIAQQILVGDTTWRDDIHPAQLAAYDRELLEVCHRNADLFGRLYEAIRNAPSLEIAEEVLLCGLLEKERAEAIHALKVKSFEKELRAERNRRALVLGALSDLGQSTYPEYCAKEGFLDMGSGMLRVLRNDPLIARSIPGPVNRTQEGLPWVGGLLLESRRFGFQYDFLFSYTETAGAVSPADEKYRIWFPMVILDAAVMDALTSVAERDGHAQEVSRILKGIRNFTTLGGHDTVHHIMFPIDRDTSDPLYFAHPKAPFVTSEKRFSDGAWWDSLSRFDDASTELSALEISSHAVNVKVWGRIFERHPALKSKLIENAGRYLEAVDSIRPAVSALNGSDFAGRMSGYLIDAALNQLHLVIPIDDPALWTPDRRGVSFMQRLAAMDLPVPEPELSTDHRLAIIREFGSYPEPLQELLSDQELFSETALKRVLIPRHERLFRDRIEDKSALVLATIAQAWIAEVGAEVVADEADIDSFKGYSSSKGLSEIPAVAEALERLERNPHLFGVFVRNADSLGSLDFTYRFSSAAQMALERVCLENQGKHRDGISTALLAAECILQYHRRPNPNIYHPIEAIKFYAHAAMVDMRGPMVAHLAKLDDQVVADILVEFKRAVDESGLKTSPGFADIRSGSVED